MMKTGRYLIIILLIIMVQFFPSCVKSQIGECIRVPQKEYLYLNSEDAIEAYKTADRQFVLLIEESIQTREEKWIFWNDELCRNRSPNSLPVAERKTGNKVWVKRLLRKPCSDLKLLEESPDLTDATPMELPFSGYEYIRQLPDQDQSTWWRITLAAPFDYTIDPIITTSCSMVYGVTLGGALIYQYIKHFFKNLCD